MESNDGKTEEFLSVVNKLTAALLLLAVIRWPYSYYIFLRWFVLVSALLHVGVSISRRRFMALFWFVPIGLLFNPIDPVFLSKGVWVALDLLAALFFVIGYKDLSKA